MKTLLILFLLSQGQPSQQTPCEKCITLKLSQTSYTLNVWKHIRNAINAVEITLPVSCQFYDKVNVGDDLLKNKFRWGSLAVHGTMGTWNLEVTNKDATCSSKGQIQ